MSKRSVTEPGFMHKDNPYHMPSTTAKSRGVLLIGVHVIRELPSAQVVRIIEDALMEHLRYAQHMMAERLTPDNMEWERIDEGIVDLFKILRLARYEGHLKGGEFECRFRDYVNEDNSVPEIERVHLAFLMKVYPKIPRDTGLESKMLQSKRYILSRAISAWTLAFDDDSKLYFNFICSAYEPNNGFKKRTMSEENSDDFRYRELYTSQEEKNLIEDLLRKRIKSFPAEAIALWADKKDIPQKLRECLLIGWAKRIDPQRLREIALANK